MRVAVIGGGASGLCCAIEAAKGAHCEVTVYESKDRVGKKLLATGNGRCNMLNCYATADDYSAPSFVRGVLEKYDAAFVRRFFEELGLYSRQDEEGRVYPLSNQATSVLDVLRFECERLGVETLCSAEITSIKYKSGKFLLSDGKAYDRVALCCGGKAGAKNFGGYELLKDLGHTVTKLMPALTKLTVKDNTYTRQLKGIRHKTELSLYIDGEKTATENGELLFTDYGLSGIAVMQLSSLIARHMRHGKSLPEICCDFVPDMSFNELCDSIKKITLHNKDLKCENLLTGFMPKKLGEAVVKSAGVPITKAVGQLSDKEIKSIASLAKKFSFTVFGLRPFDDAQVVSGGASLREFDSVTLQSLKYKNLYACGELLDVDGPCGGYNLLWAFASGIAVGRQINNDKNK
ncbi:MAG: aminoacetone oxidase family FAD-binding enzyme [Clostridia bacterium]|nr:aminoacetone oxidase family FAD-binding enzyme [Clostridia bacterium]